MQTAREGSTGKSSTQFEECGYATDAYVHAYVNVTSALHVNVTSVQMFQTKERQMNREALRIYLRTYSNMFEDVLQGPDSGLQRFLWRFSDLFRGLDVPLEILKHFVAFLQEDAPMHRDYFKFRALIWSILCDTVG